jgi:hypothetical protein
MSPDVLIYVQTMKHYFSNNVDAQKYFAISGNEEEFYNNIKELSQKNYEEYGEPELSIEQFEELRKKIFKLDDKENEIVAAFMNIGNFGYSSLN